MNNPRTLLFTIAATAALSVAAAPAARAGVSTESPFAPRGFGVGTTVSNTPIELRGIMSDDQGTRFAIYDPAKKEGAWVRMGEEGKSYVVRSYDAESGRIVVDYQGRPQTLTMVDPKFGPAKTAAVAVVTRPGMAPQQMQAQPGGRPNLGQQQGAQPQAQASTAENTRLEAIRAEIARRRAQRGSGGSQ